MKNILKNWKTSSAGIVLISTGIMTMVNAKAYSEQGLLAILGGIGFLYTADASSTNIPDAK